MEIKKYGVFLCLALPACATNNIFNSEKTEAFYVKDYEVNAEQGCLVRDVNLNNPRAKQFFTRAHQLDYQTLSANYPTAPCSVMGTVTYQKRICNWEVSAAGTGWISCDKRSERRWYFACDDCRDLLTYQDTKQ